MGWITVPVIEYEVFIAACPYECWKPRFPPTPDSCTLGSRLSTLTVFKNIDGVAQFYSHDHREMLYFQRGIEEHFDVEVVEVE